MRQQQLNNFLHSSINCQFVANWVILGAAACIHDESVAILEKLSVCATVDKLRLLFPQHAVQINVQRVLENIMLAHFKDTPCHAFSYLFQHNSICFIVDFYFPRFNDFRLRLIVNFPLESVDEKFVGVFEASCGENLRGWRKSFKRLFSFNQSSRFHKFLKSCESFIFSTFKALRFQLNFLHELCIACRCLRRTCPRRPACTSCPSAALLRH